MSKNDKEIDDIAKCSGATFTFTKLEDIYKYHRSHNIQKIISLDVKSWFENKCSLYSNNMMAYYHKYDMEKYVVVESEVAYFLDKVKRRSAIDCYLSTFGDFKEGCRKALKFKYEGISFAYDRGESIDADDIELIHRKGLRIQVWVINDLQQIETLKNMKVDFIQTDNW